MKNASSAAISTPSSNMTELPKLTVAASNLQLCQVLNAALDNDSYQFHIASSATECLNQLTDTQVVFVDLILEDMDGLSLIEEIRMRHRGMHIIAIMCKDELATIDMSAEEVTLMAARSGANAVFIAPFNLGELLTTVERFCENSYELA